MNEQPYFCCGNLPSEGHTRWCLQQNDHDADPVARAALQRYINRDVLHVGQVLTLEDGRQVAVSGMPDGTVCHDYKRRIAVRNVKTHRLSYIPAWRLLRAARLTWEDR